MISKFCELLDVGVVVEQTTIEALPPSDDVLLPVIQSTYWIVILAGLRFVILYSYETQGLDVGVGVGVEVGVGVGVGVTNALHCKQAPSFEGPTSFVNDTTSTPLIFSNNPS